MNVIATNETGLPAKRVGDWMQTYSGRQFWPIDARPEEIGLDDIAHSLAMQCRFAGHCDRFYSVAEHSWLLSRAVPPAFARWALLHDASEAYILDVVRPLKPALAGYREIEDRLMVAICVRFDLSLIMPPEVKDADNRILIDERDQNMSPAPAPWSVPDAGLGVTLLFLSPAEAERMFLARAAELGIS